MKVNGQNRSRKGSRILAPNESVFICVGCGHEANEVVVLGASRTRVCPQCKYMAMLPKETPEIDVLRMRVAFLEQVSTQTIETLQEVIISKDKEIERLEGVRHD